MSLTPEFPEKNHPATVSQLNLKALFDAGAHYGHRVRFWHPSNERYVYGRHGGIHIINLDRTIEAFDRALGYLKSLAADNKKILFVCTKRVAQGMLGEAARNCRMPYVDSRWLGGTLTNFATVRQSISRLNRVEKMLEDDSLREVYVKKEVLKMSKSHQKLLRSFGGIRSMTDLPDALFVIDVGYERIAVAEAKRLDIPVVGIVDTNHSSEDIAYPIPGNDDSMSAIHIYLDTASQAIASALPEVLEGEEGPVKPVPLRMRGRDRSKPAKARQAVDSQPEAAADAAPAPDAASADALEAAPADDAAAADGGSEPAPGATA